MDSQTITLLLLFLFTQNKSLMAEVAPALDFLEHHQSAVDTISHIFSTPTATPSTPNAQNGQNEQKEPPMPAFFEQNGQEKTQSPLEKIANESILSQIQAYLSKQGK